MTFSSNANKRSDHFDGKRFFVPGKKITHSFWQVLKWRLMEKRPKWPKQVALTSFAHDHLPPKGMRFTYIGHATVLIEIGRVTILTDPHFSQRASPLQWIGPKRVTPPGLTIEQLPSIDLIFISHNHYDHLDLLSLKKICNPKTVIVTPLGNEKIIHKILPEQKVETLDWYESRILFSTLFIQLFPAHHWSARTPFDSNLALWGSAFFKVKERSFFFMGDSGYDPLLFAAISQKLKQPPEVALLPIGAYHPRWLMSAAHMSPKEAWTAFKQLKSSYLLPIHYDTFPLGDEPYGKALPSLFAEAKQEKGSVLALKAGESFDLAV